MNARSKGRAVREGAEVISIDPALIIALHRQTTIAQAVDLIAQQVGEERAPSKSALGRMWKQLDMVRGAA